MKILEKDIQKTITDYLKLKGIFHYKNNTVGIYKKATNSYIPSPSAGAPDIVAVIKGLYVGIEVKNKTKQSDSQKAFQENLEKAGGKYYLVHSLEEVKQQLQWTN